MCSNLHSRSTFCNKHSPQFVGRRGRKRMFTNQSCSQGLSRTIISFLCALAVLSVALVSCGGADATVAHPTVVVGNQNTGVLHGQYIWKSQGFSVSDHLPFVDADGGRFDFHALRSQFATELARANVSLAAAQKLMRHSTPALTSNHYTALGLLDLLRTSTIAVLGGDVYARRAGRFNPARENWYVEQEPLEQPASFAARSHVVASNYLARSCQSDGADEKWVTLVLSETVEPAED